VVDLDNKSGFPGKEWFESNFFKLENTSETIVTSTISGGYHVYFKYTSSVKNKNNYLDMNVDLLVDKKCVYEGKGYSIISSTNNIRELTKDEIKLLNQEKRKEKTFEETLELVKKGTELVESQKWFINNPRILKTINKHIPTDLSREWDMEYENDSLKCTPRGCKCIVDPLKTHSIENHCTLFINKDGTVVKNCHSHGSQTLGSVGARVLQRELKLVIELQNEETNVYCRLKDYMLEVAFENSYMRDKNGNIYKRVKSFAYVFYCEYKDFLNDIFRDDKEFERNPNNIENLVKFLKDFDSSSFPFINPNKRYLGFNNGILDTHNATFIPELECDSTIIVKKYLDIQFSGETDTPLFDSIFDFQLKDNPKKQEIKEFIYFCLGRLFGVRDKYDFTLYLMGEAGCGKSLVIDVMKQFFRDVGAVSSNLEKVFGLASLYDKDLIICDDLPKNFSNVLPQTIFQTWISGGELSIAFKGGSAKTVKWEAPLLFAGNYNPDYVDKGQISRRVLTFEFSRIVPDDQKDTGLLRKISKNELDKLALKSILTYNKYITNPILMEKSIWSICPEYFRENQEELRKDRNPLYAFLKDNFEYSENNEMSSNEIKDLFEKKLGKTIRKLDYGTFIQADSRYIIIPNKQICKHCNKEAKAKLKEEDGCCEYYNHKDRIKGALIKNIK
jgi:hypothetical protein